VAKRSLGLIVLAFIVLGCRGDPASEAEDSSPVLLGGRPVQVSDIDPREFVLVRSQGAGVLARSRAQLAFKAGKVRFTGGCNTASGSYSLSDGTLVVTELWWTQAFCEGNGSDQDQVLSGFMVSSPHAEMVADNTLSLRSLNVTLQFLDRELEPHLPLIDSSGKADLVTP